MSIWRFLKHYRAARRAARASPPAELTAADVTAFFWVVAWLVQILVELVNIALPLAVAVICSTLTGFGDHLQPQLFTVLSGVMPLVLVGAVVEFGLVGNRIIREEGSPPSLLARDYIRRVGRTYFAWFGISEGAALYAVATRSTSTFLLLAVVTPLALFVQDIALTAPLKFSVDDLAWNRLGKRWRSGLKRKADQLRAEGDIGNAERLEGYLGDVPGTLSDAAAALRAFD